MSNLFVIDVWKKGTNRYTSEADYRIDIEEGDSDMLRELIDAIRGDKKC